MLLSATPHAGVGAKGKGGGIGARREKTAEREVLAEELRNRLIAEEIESMELGTKHTTRKFRTWSKGQSNFKRRC